MGTSFEESLHVIDSPNASWFAADLFKESFGAEFPSPRPYFGVPDDPLFRTWHQYVAFYKWSATHIEPVGFCNWIRYGDVYLEGGMCVQRDFYRRLSKQHWSECKAVGGIAQVVMETAARALTDADAWFGYCGDKKALLVNSRVGYVPTRHRFLIVKWLRDLPRSRQSELEDHVAKLGPF